MGHLISTIRSNLNPGSSKPLIQRKATCDNLSVEVLQGGRKPNSETAQTLLESADQGLARRDRDAAALFNGTGRYRARFGIFFFEERYSEEDS